MNHPSWRRRVVRGATTTTTTTTPHLLLPLRAFWQHRTRTFLPAIFLESSSSYPRCFSSSFYSFSRRLAAAHHHCDYDRSHFSTTTTTTSSSSSPSPFDLSDSSTRLSHRRRKPRFQSLPETDTSRTAGFGRMREPFRATAGTSSGGADDESVVDYLDKASLSPWVPLPDVACRAALELADVSEQDSHVDLGSGDGRVNFHALDHFHVANSLGIDVDPDIVNVALQRVAQRHPTPTNLQFVVADLLNTTTTTADNNNNNTDNNTDIWHRILDSDTTIVTMYFAPPALEQLRPLLEEKLVRIRGPDRPLRIVTAGYPMPHWQPHASRVVLGTQLHLYKWGGHNNTTNNTTTTIRDGRLPAAEIVDEDEDDEDDDEDYDDDDEEEEEVNRTVFGMEDQFLLPDDNSLARRRQDHLEGNKFQGANIIDRTTPGGQTPQELYDHWKAQEEEEEAEKQAHSQYEDEDDAWFFGPDDDEHEHNNNTKEKDSPPPPKTQN